MRVFELHRYFEKMIPAALSCEWDNDGLLVCPDPQREVKKVLVALDVTSDVAERAIKEGYDLILSHHPIIFSPISHVEPSDPVAKKVLLLLSGGVSVMSFHTRLDALAGGVNDMLAELLGLCYVRAFGDEGIGRIGVLPKAVPLDEFARFVKEKLELPTLSYAGKGPVECVALLGGSGADDLEAALAAGADTYLSGELKYHQLAEAAERGQNLLAAGHFDSEKQVCRKLAAMAKAADETLEVTLMIERPYAVI